ncbi:MAG: universal stress protein [Myxococcota bacterium]
MNIRTILVPVDFTTCARLVTDQAASLATRLGAKVVVLHVAPLPTGVSPAASVAPDGVAVPVGQYLAADSRARLETFAAVVRAHGAPVELVAEVGPVVATILRTIDAVGADLVMMGTHGRSGLVRLVLGSVAEGVTHQAHVPVMLIRREPRPECARGSCAWCTEQGTSPAEDRVAVETQG